MPAFLSQNLIAFIAVISTTILLAIVLNNYLGIKRTILILGAIICFNVGFYIGTDFFRDLNRVTENPLANFTCDEGIHFQLRSIYIASQDISRGSILDEEMFNTSSLPVNMITEFVIVDIKQVIGASAANDIKRGMILTKDLLILEPSEPD